MKGAKKKGRHFVRGRDALTLVIVTYTGEKVNIRTKE